ncbi:chorismate synthase [Marinoscillum sp. 108]|uniref:Chorismate synthase n=1 Tax=Marinoscillum luteum TaxID=861051 RepID=A0ABW7N8R2_9BACT|nr:chorismate synthase [Marinoscillum sp. 108]VXD20888.1 chorismate synthase [Marinoscillum sp. 108]
MGNIFGKIFSITTFGESHGVAIGVTINGCPAGIPIDMAFIQSELSRRKPGQSKITTQRKEEDEVEILSGVFEGLSTGTPIGLLIRNKDQKSKDYSHIAEKFRPSHADYTYHEKYGVRDYRGGGRSSARETAARVAAGAVAKLMLKEFGISFHAYVSQVGTLKLEKSYEQLDLSKTEDNAVRCPDPEMAQQMFDYIDDVRKSQDTVGGVVTGVIKGVPVGLGEPVFDKLHAELGKAMLSINAVKGFEYGSGFEGIKMKGSAHNDAFYVEDGTVKTKTNLSGGIQGGISNGQDIYFNVAFKPVATIMQDQASIDTQGNEVTVSGKGRHDPCVVPRAVPIVEAMAALVIADFYLIARTNKLRG